jgi:putative FmdB family regulatory protein
MHLKLSRPAPILAPDAARYTCRLFFQTFPDSEDAMPIYAYRCSSCGFQNDYLQKVSDPVLSSCPECGQETFAKQLTAAGFQLKGSGWYVTDFRNNGTKPAAKANGEGKGDAAKAEGGKAEGAKAESGKSEIATESKSDTSSGTSSAAASGTGASPACS